MSRETRRDGDEPRRAPVPDEPIDDLLADIEQWGDDDWAGDDWADETDDAAESHRGAFGEFGGETSGLIEQIGRAHV